MTINVNTIPVNSPIADSEGRISPAWYQFFRSFLAATVDGSISPDGVTTSVTAGKGLVGGGTGNVVLDVGPGPGITVNDNTVAVDIPDLHKLNLSLDDETLVNYASQNNTLGKTTVRDIVNLAGTSPAGANTQVQYNSANVFAADSGFTYDGAGNAVIGSTLEVGNINISGTGAVDAIHFDGTSGPNVARIQTDGGGGYTLWSSNAGTDNAGIHMRTGVPWVEMDIGANNSIQISSLVGGNYGILITGQLPLRRCLLTNVTASTIQTQGQSVLTGDYNNITTVANNNDVVTMPSAMVARYCLIRNAGAHTLQVFPASGNDAGAGVNTSITISPGSVQIWFAIDSTTWYTLSGITRNSTTAGITASVTQTQGNQPLTADVNEVHTVANNNDVVTLPAAPAFSRTVIIINNGANTLQIFPASGNNLGAGLNTSTTLAPGSNVRFTNYDAVNWEIT